MAIKTESSSVLTCDKCGKSVHVYNPEVKPGWLVLTVTDRFSQTVHAYIDVCPDCVPSVVTTAIEARRRSQEKP